MPRAGTILLCAIGVLLLGGCSEQNGAPPTQPPLEAPKQAKLEPTLSIEGTIPFLALLNGQEIGRGTRVDSELPSPQGHLAVFPRQGPAQYFTLKQTGGQTQHITLSSAPASGAQQAKAMTFNDSGFWDRHAQASQRSNKHLKDTETLLKLGLKTFPKHAPLWRLRAHYLNDVKQYEAALNACERFLQLAPNDPKRQEIEQLKKKLAPQMDDSAPIPTDP